MKKIALHLGTGLLLAGLMTAALAAGEADKMADKKMDKMAPAKAATPKGKTSQMTATINKMDGDKLMVMPTAKGKKATEQTVTVPATAKIMKGKTAMKMADLKAGDKVTFYMSNGAVTKVMVHDASKMTPKMDKMDKMAPKKS